MPKFPFTVIATVEGTGEIRIYTVEATSDFDAFRVAANASMDPRLDFVVALSGHQTEGTTFTLPGEGVVCTQTVLEQTDVFC